MPASPKNQDAERTALTVHAVPDGAGAEVESTELTREQALARFHVRLSDGRIASGAQGFVEIWKTLPRWRWAARAGACAHGGAHKAGARARTCRRE